MMKRTWRGIVAAAATTSVMLFGAAAAAAAPAAPAAPATDADAYEPTKESLSGHSAPQWFDDAKLGFFVHWGAYSVPAYAPLTGTENKYSEWYWAQMNTAGSSTQKYHEKTYGRDFAYDDFLREWKAESWDPNAWLDLFERGGGKYYVLTAKHHDGIALYDTDVSDRSTVEYGPKRDFVGELSAANRAGDYGLKEGVYFSLPEWHNPASPVQWGGWFGSGAPRNPFTQEEVPYTGYLPVDDYVKDFQLPQMKELVDKYDPDIMWCDIGGVNDSNDFMAYYFNNAAGRKDVTINDRCGNNVSDYSTPEYSVEPDIKASKWEASRGLGQSYGYNAQEGVAQTLTPDGLVDSFVDVVSKNGNLLLNIGPKADGTVPELQASRVRALGDWLDVNGEAIYGSRYWTQAEDAGATVPVRFTTQPEAFYATALDWPGEKLTLSADVPIERGDTITLLGQDKPLKWTKRADGLLEITTQGTRGAQPYAYTFRIASKGYDAETATLLGVEMQADAAAVGETAQVTVTLANRGDQKVNAGTLSIDVPFGEPVVHSFDALPPHTRTTFTIDVDVPATASPGSAAIEVTAKPRKQGEFTASTDLAIVGESVPVTLPYDFDSIATADAPNDGSFGSAPVAYPADEIPAPGELMYEKVRFLWPSGENGVNNNLNLNGQAVDLPPGQYRRLHLLAAAADGPGTSTVTVTYADGTTTDESVTVADWMTGGDPAVFTTAHRYAWGSKADAVTKMYRYEVAIDPEKTVASVAFAKPSGAPSVAAHLFALTAER
ncbi:alpha-L-fucosidase [Agromyces italicus]|uniref:alpha-L-fucosidase n=1 Tax=Agromyces italicus TaxID=279572 RepID=UPI0003B62AA7|nr:alpha-L-fucosidase [Agromyces italicus]